MNDEEVTSEILLMNDEITSEISLEINTGSRPDTSKLIKPKKLLAGTVETGGTTPSLPFLWGGDKISKLIKLKTNPAKICLLMTYHCKKHAKP